MKRLMIVAALLAVVSAEASADERFEPYGFSYFTAPEVVGTVTTIVAFLEPPVGFTYPVSVDFANNEYTFVVQATVASITPGAFITIIDYSDATFFIYKDPAQNGGYGVMPPNGASPSTFQDGEIILTGTFSGWTRIDLNFGFPEPTMVAGCTFTGGTQFGEIVVPSGWTFNGGLSTSPFTGIPAGYQRNWATRIFFSGSVPVKESSWGAIKSLYASD